jgi:hypothetical protein
MVIASVSKHRIAEHASGGPVSSVIRAACGAVIFDHPYNADYVRCGARLRTLALCAVTSSIRMRASGRRICALPRSVSATTVDIDSSLGVLRRAPGRDATSAHRVACRRRLARTMSTYVPWTRGQTGARMRVGREAPVDAHDRGFVDSRVGGLQARGLGGNGSARFGEQLIQVPERREAIAARPGTSRFGSSARCAAAAGMGRGPTDNAWAG